MKQEQDTLRLRMAALMLDYGTTQSYIARCTHIDRADLSKFKAQKMILAPAQAQRLDTFLSQRGYRDELGAMDAIINGTFQ